MLLNRPNQSTKSLASIMPSNIQKFVYNYEDEYPEVTENRE